MGKTAFITGITGQDGSYLAELLLHLGYEEVHGLVRRASLLNTSRLENIYEGPQNRNRRLIMHYGDLTDSSRVGSLIGSIKPHEFYNLAAQSHVGVSFVEPVHSVEVDGLAVAGLLESIRILSPETRVYQASTSEMFGSVPSPQNLGSGFSPNSPYAAAKLASHHMVGIYREAYGLYAVSGVLFNHESFRRGPTFVTKKITVAASRIRAGLQSKLFLGNLEALRDWGYAPEFVIGMWRSLQENEPFDFLLATGTRTSVRDFAVRAFDVAGLQLEQHLEIDTHYLRPLEVEDLCGDLSYGVRPGGWAPNVSGLDLAEKMTREDLAAMSAQGDRPHLDVPDWDALIAAVLAP